MTPKRFPTRRSDGTATVVVALAAGITTNDVRRALDDWNSQLAEAGVEWTRDLGAEPVVEDSDRGVEVILEIKAGSNRWRDWYVWLLSTIREQVGRDPLAGLFDAVDNRWHDVRGSATGDR